MMVICRANSKASKSVITIEAKFLLLSAASSVFVMVGRGTSDTTTDGGLIFIPGSRMRSLFRLTGESDVVSRVAITSKIRLHCPGNIGDKASRTKEDKTGMTTLSCLGCQYIS